MCKKYTIEVGNSFKIWHLKSALVVLEETV
jgi:hypothetical protein